VHVPIVVDEGESRLCVRLLDGTGLAGKSQNGERNYQGQPKDSSAGFHPFLLVIYAVVGKREE
jgi:hypothetical protein